MVNLKAGDFPRDRGVSRDLLDGSAPGDARMPVVLVGYDQPNTFAYLPPGSPDVERRFAEALANLGRIEIEAVSHEIGNLELLVVSGHFYAAESSSRTETSPAGAAGDVARPPWVRARIAAARGRRGITPGVYSGCGFVLRARVPSPAGDGVRPGRGSVASTPPFREGPMRLHSPVPAFVAFLAACTVKAPGPESSPPPAGAIANGSFSAELNGFRIHYEVHGQGPVLMTVPNSWGLSLQGLRAMYRPLEDRLTLVYFDPRGMGGSGPVQEDADRGLAAVRVDFQALRTHLKLDKVGAIGWSNGAINLIWLASEHPETLSSAIFVHGLASFTAEDMKQMQATHPEVVERYGAFLAEIAKPGLTDAQKTARQRKLWLDEYFPSLCADPVAGKALVASVFQDAQLSWPHAARTNEEAGTFDARDELAAIPVRSLVIAGAHDMLPPERVKPLADGLPHATFVVFGRSGHFSPVEEPDAFRAAVHDFLGVSASGR
jgi:proline iminopeptidase